MMSYLLNTLGCCLLVAVIGGCSTVNKVLPDYRDDYKKSKTAPLLEVPPDLIGSTDIDQEKVGLDDKKEKPRLRAKLRRSQDGHKNLIVYEDFARAWRRTGLALEGIGLTLEDRDRSRGLYFLQADGQEYLIRLIEGSSSTRIVVLNSKGQTENSETTEKILSLLYEQLK